MNLRTPVFTLVLLLIAVGGAPHPRGSSTGLAELNDALMAIRWLAEEDDEAGALFERWLELKQASWAIRTLTDEEDRTEGAHSNPVYTTLAGRPRASAADARPFIGVLDRLAEWVRTRGLFETDDQRQAVLRVIAEGRAVYERIVESDPRRSLSAPESPPQEMPDSES